MGDILKFIAITTLILFILAFALPLLWFVIHLAGWLFGGIFGALGSSFIWIAIFVVSVIAIIVMLAN